MGIIESIKRLFKKPPVVMATASDILEIIGKDVIHKVTLNDQRYILPTEKEVRRALLDLGISYLRSEREKDFFDCDDFAIILWGKMKEYRHGWAFGRLNVNNKRTALTHALNFFISNERKMILVEPQESVLVKAWESFYDVLMVEV